MTPQNQNPEPPLPDLRNLGDQKQVDKTRGGWLWWWILPVVAALAFWWAAWGWGNTGGYWWGPRTSHLDNPANGAIENSDMKNGLGSANGAVANNNVRSNSPNSPTPATPSAVVQTGPPPSGPGIKVLDAVNKLAFIGKPFQADNVPVERKVNDRALWIATSSNPPMLAVVSGSPNTNPSSAPVRPGSAVDASGTIEAAPSATQAKQQWDLTDADVARMEKEGVYIQVSRLTLPH